VDAAGNVSDAASFQWKVSAVGFTIAGNPVGYLYPGVWRPIAITFTNPNSYAIIVNSLTVSASSSPSGCPASTNIEFQQSPLSSTHTFTVPAHSTATLTAADRPQIRLKNLPVNQDVCKGGTFGLAYAGTATK
jgi:hypothetical protein